jgi:hypothetical protein
MQVGIKIWLTLCVVGTTRASSCAAAWLLLLDRKADRCIVIKRYLLGQRKSLPRQ